jgi:hypothetical protein
LPLAIEGDTFGKLLLTLLAYAAASGSLCRRGRHVGYVIPVTEGCEEFSIISRRKTGSKEGPLAVFWSFPQKKMP